MRRRTLTFVAANGGADFLVTGPLCSELIRGARVEPVWSRVHGGWLIYAREAADVVAYAEHRGVVVYGITSEAAAELRDLAGVKTFTPRAGVKSLHISPCPQDDQLELFDIGSR